MVLLITGAWRDAKQHIKSLEASGDQVWFLQNEQDPLPCDKDIIQGVVCNSLFLYHDISEFSSLRFIQLTSAGLDRAPLEYIHDHGIALYNARGVYSVPMAEHAVTAALQFFRNSRFFYENAQNHIWQKDRGLRELCGSNVCVIGCGSVGAECAKRFSAMGCKVYGVDVKPYESPFFISMSGLDEMSAMTGRADVIVLSAPLTVQTETMVNEEFLRSLKSGCVLINISRGRLIDEKALIRALGEKELYAALDVFDGEPLPADSPLWDMDNVFITPHNSFVGDGCNKRLNDLIMRNVATFSGGDWE